MDHPYLRFSKRREAECRSRMHNLVNRHEEPYLRVSYNTLNTVNQAGRYNNLTNVQWRRVFDHDSESVPELTMEFLASFNFNTSTTDAWDESAVTFRLGGTWHETSVARFGIDLGIYTMDELEAKSDIASYHTFPDEEYRQHPTFGVTRHEFWSQIGLGTYSPSRTKSSKLKDPLHRYIHRLLSHSVTARGQSEGVVNLRDLFILYAMVNHQPCNISYLFCTLFAKNATASAATPLFGGSWIVQVYESYGVNTNGSAGVSPGRLDLGICDSMSMVTHLPDGRVRFQDSKGQVWDPEDPDHIIMDLDQPIPQQQHFDTGASSSRGPEFPSMLDLYEAIQTTTTYARRSFELSEATASRMDQLYGRVDNVCEDVAYLRRRMYSQWGDEDEPQNP
ncbi:hypothetical protein L1987_32456 [Smallanthus sonchifolius]|uniref:Uncharacterized protein n=1 Tax=Smallanthus sonchifolius TaxID=185202 RepID=A0ACB9HPM3_9ASTR|nr:hypothetical protein L1987_32456 [Smallanthus sonchifolius]